MEDNSRDIHEMDQILDKEAFDIGWKEYQNIIWKESGNFLERYPELRDVPYGIASGTIIYRSALQWKPPTTGGKSAENLEEYNGYFRNDI